MRHHVVLSGRCSRSSNHAHRHPAWSTLFAPVQLSGGYRTEVPTLLTARARMHESRRQFIFQSVAFYACKMMTDALPMNSGIQMPSSINNRIMDRGPTLQHRAHMFRLGPRDHERHVYKPGTVMCPSGGNPTLISGVRKPHACPPADMGTFKHGSLHKHKAVNHWFWCTLHDGRRCKLSINSAYTTNAG